MSSFPTRLQVNGWVKCFLDGTREEGYDNLVDKKLASWQKGKLDNIIEVKLYHEGKGILLLGRGTYWQSDDWEVPLFTSPGYFKTRRIERQISSTDHHLLRFQNENDTIFACIDDLEELYDEDDIIHKFDIDDIGHWLCIEMNAQSKEVSWYINEDKI